MHPMLRDGVSIGTFTNDEYPGEEFYYAENASGEQYELGYNVFREILHADGTHPLRLPAKLVYKLKKAKILSTNRYVFDGIHSRFILLPIGENAKKYRSVCRLINYVLPVVSVLLFLSACILKKNRNDFYMGDLNIPIYYLLIIFSLTLHEAAHFVAGNSYGYKFTEAGLLLAVIFPIGAYVAHHDKKNIHGRYRAQFSLAGIEANLLMSALFLFLSMNASSLDWTFVMAANINIVLSMLNALPAKGLDGEQALSALLGMDIAKNSKRFLNRKYRRKLLRSGATGYTVAAIYAFSLLSTMAVSALILYDFANLILSFFI